MEQTIHFDEFTADDKLNNMVEKDFLKISQNQEMMALYNYFKTLNTSKTENFEEVFGEEGKRLLAELLPGRITKNIWPIFQDLASNPAGFHENMKMLSTAELRLFNDFLADLFVLSYRDHKDKIPQEMKMFYLLFRSSGQNTSTCSIL